MTIQINGHKLPAGKWWQRPFSMYQTNLREIDATMDVEKVAQYIKEYGASAWLIGVGGILAYYPTKLPFQATNPYLSQRLSGDLVQDAVDAAHANGLRLLARMDFSKITPAVAAEHPDWLFRSPSGDVQSHTADLVSVCPNGPYYQEKVFEIIEEICKTYPLDGFFVNWVSFNEVDYDKRYCGVCHCDNCKTAWRKARPDVKLPKGRSDEGYMEWVDYSNGVLDEVMGRIRATISRLLPDSGLILGSTADIIFHEANNDTDRDLWHSMTSEWTGMWKAFAPDKPILVNSTVFLEMSYRMSAENPEHFAQFLVQAISRGANPSTYTMGVPGKLPYTYNQTGKEINLYHRANSRIYDGLRPMASTGLVRPNRGYFQAALTDQAVEEFRGLYSAMQETHVPFDVIPQERIAAMRDNGSLARYQVIVLPNLGPLGKDHAAALDQWVHTGGHLIATGESGVQADGSVELKSLPSTRRLSSITDHRQLFSMYFAPKQSHKLAHHYNGPTIPIVGGLCSFDYKSEVDTEWRIIGKAPHAPPEYAYGNAETDDPASVGLAYGLGRGVQIPLTIGKIYRQLGLTPARQFFIDTLIKEGGNGENFRLDIAEQVEATFNVNGSSLVIHLINMSGARKKNFGPYLPIRGGKLAVPPNTKSVKAVRAGIELEVHGGQASLPELNLFEVIVIETQ